MSEDVMETQAQTAPQEKAPALPQPVLYRVRLTFARGDALRYVSHLDLHLVWERTLRRAGAPLAYSQGFNPRPKLHLASALPLGFLSRCEIIDFWLQGKPDEPAPDMGQLIALLKATTPPGLEILSGDAVPLNLPALQTQVRSAEYLAHPLDLVSFEDLGQAVAALLEQESLPRERRGKPYDLRPLIERLETQPGDRPGLFMRLTARESATGRPEEVLLAMGFDPAAFRVERTALILE
jgi:radical SAM-linked protein